MTNKTGMSRIFGVFSRRSQPSHKANTPLTPQFKSRVLRLCTSTFLTYYPTFGLVSSVTEFWSEIREKLLYLHGRQTLSSTPTSDPIGEITGFLFRCRDEHFLDFIELIFQIGVIWEETDPKTGHLIDIHTLIEDINVFLQADDLPYYLTGFIVTDGRIEAYPQIIRRDSEVLHETAIKPTLALLSQPMFTSANDEFLDALKDFRTGDYRDCVAKCGSSLESVMKIICHRKGWSYQQNDTAAPLLKHILPQTKLDSYFEQPIMLIATIRNRLSTAHGAGTQQKAVSRHVASYVINSTASTILLLVGETEP